MNCLKMRLQLSQRPVEGIYCQAIPTTAEIQGLAVADFCNNVGADVAYRNRGFFHLKLTKGISYEYRCWGQRKSAVHIYPSIIKTQKTMLFCVNQFSIVGKTNAVLILSFTSTEYLWCFWTEKLGLTKTTISEAFNQIQHYWRTFRFFEYNALTIVSE
jgi:hypothetical protein